MLKLKYLFNNVDLAEMLLRNWEFEEGSLELFKYYRISSNAIYPFQSQGKTQILRFAPKSEKRRENILAELEFISYLRSKQFGVLETVASKNGEVLEEKQTPWGEYNASVFRRVSGVQLSDTDLNNTIIFNYGQALGKLHQLSSEYKPKTFKRWSYSDVLNWMYNILVDSPLETSAIEETKLLKHYFDSIPITERNFGLIHYDFELDNVFYDEEIQSCNVIDFDDSMYHWYVMDIEQALDSLKESISPEIFPLKKQCFMDGYRSKYDISDDMMSLIPACRRFANLYGYVRILLSIKEMWDHEPQWVTSLRKRLAKSMKDKSACFGAEIK